MFRRIATGTIEGVPYEHWRAGRDPDDVRIPNNWLEAVTFLYETVEDARESSHLGGTGFVIGLPAETITGRHLYVVTNRHVAESCPVVRVARPAGVSTVEYEEDEWTFHPEGDDVAVASLPVSVTPLVIPTHSFITEELYAELDLGPGDEAMILGRFVGLDGRVHNSPTMRSGQMAMLGLEQIRSDYTKLNQESFVLEMRTLAGYSGSPAFVTIPPVLFGPYAAEMKKQGKKRRVGTWVLGIEWGNLHRYQRVREKRGEGREAEYVPIDEPWWVRENSGMSCVVPAWKIVETLMSENLKKKRAETEAQERDRREVVGGAATTGSGDEEIFTKEKMEDALRKVSRRKGVPEPNSGTTK